MNERSTDFELLRAFLREGNQSAFGALVQRHLDLVYATAWRKTGDAGGAEEVAQNVFLALARKGWQFASDDSLPGFIARLCWNPNNGFAVNCAENAANPWPLNWARP